MNKTNCYKVCQFYHYFDEQGNFHCTDKCPQKYNKLILEEKMCVNDCKNSDIYKYNYNNTCLKKCPNDTFTDENNNICYNYKNIKTTLINEINNNTTFTIEDERDIQIEKFREKIFDFNVSDDKEIVETIGNVQYQMTTSEFQKNNTNKNISTINLGDCETKLKKEYKIDPSLPLIIFKIDYFSPDTSIPIIGYEIYHPITKEKLNLTICEDILIQLNIPVNIDENNLFKYDPNSDFYNDNCFTYTTENGTDIILNDRKQEFTDNNLSLCEKNCNYTGYNEQNKQSSCDCNIKNKMDLISEIIENPNKLSNNFEDEENDSNSGASNIISLKCTKALFSKEGLKSNISSYILMIFITYFLLSIMLFIKCGYPLLVNIINEIIQEKEKIFKQKENNNKLLRNQNKGNKKNGKIKLQRKKINFPPKKYKLNFVNNANSFERNNNLNNKLRKKIAKKKSNINGGKNRINNYTKKNKNTHEIINILDDKDDDDNHLKPKLNTKIKLGFNDYELNSFDYKNAILYDERTCYQYYISLLKVKNPIIFSFCPIKDYNSIIIKSSMFGLSFSIYYAMNFIFFDDEIMHEIYEVGGKYDIMYFIPKIAISFGVSYYITVIIKIIFLSERNINEIRKQITPSVAYSISEKERKNLMIKYTIYFILGIIFLGFFWMLLSSFGAIYPNTQIFIFKNTLISFALSLIYPFFISIFPCIFRISSLSSKNSEYLYKVSKFLQIL